MSLTTRRRFLCSAAGIGALAALPVGFGWISGRGGTRAAGPLRSFNRTGYALGTDVKIVVLHSDADVAERAMAEAFKELETVEQVMSLYRPDSQVVRLNNAGSLDRPHPHLLSILHESQALAGRSGGAFDVTVQPLWDLYAKAFRDGGKPTDEQVKAVLQHVDYRRLEVGAERIRLRGKGMGVTLNGIAQGFAADRVMAVLREHGVMQALINTGEIGPMGRNLQDRPWRVGIQHPREPKAYIALADLAGRSLATSGDYETTFGADYRDHHIFDPGTGHSPVELASVSVVAPTTTQADGLSTALFVLGPEKGRQLLADSAADALYVLKDGTVLSTPGFPRVNS